MSQRNDLFIFWGLPSGTLIAPIGGRPLYLIAEGSGEGDFSLSKTNYRGRKAVAGSCNFRFLDHAFGL